jgi:ubiquinone/menaquinone biosynthesis C-methylase UbiE
MSFSNAQIKAMYDRFSDHPWFWEVDAVTCRATENSPYRARAIEFLNLNPEASVLDVACGTGLNFKLLQSYLQNRGKLVGVELSEKTIQLAHSRVRKHGWTNVELVEQSAADYESETHFDAALCTFAIEIIPPYRETLDAMLRAVKPGGRIAFIGFKDSSHHLFKKLNLIFRWMSVLFGGIDMDRDVRGYLLTRSREVACEECFGGFYYILVIEKPEIDKPRQKGP